MTSPEATVRESHWLQRLFFLLLTIVLAALATILTPSRAFGATVDVYRLLNPRTGEHLYTKDANEKNSLLTYSNWLNDGVAWRSPSGGEPVYRLYQPNGGDHMYTTDVNEYNTLPRIAGWRQEGVCWNQRRDGSVPVYRLFNPHAKGAGTHLWTTDVNEYNTLGRNGWQQEDVAWYADAGGTPPSKEDQAFIKLQGWWWDNVTYGEVDINVPWHNRYLGYHIVGHKVYRYSDVAYSDGSVGNLADIYWRSYIPDDMGKYYLTSYTGSHGDGFRIKTGGQYSALPTLTWYWSQENTLYQGTDQSTTCSRLSESQVPWRWLANAWQE